jgi:2-polyprenyl-6-hydroxyphenyl methylase/3-demethylubiquinone-9 3-methyltransferase
MHNTAFPPNHGHAAPVPAASPAAAVNADPAELAKFQALASRWWDPTSEFKPLHQINPLRLGWIERHCGGSLGGLTAIDVGCGGGILAESMAQNGAKVTGIDLADKPLTVAELHAIDSGVPVQYEKIAVEDIAAREPGSRDLVTCMEMLEHVPDPAAIVAACARLAKPGGHVFFSTINRSPKSFLFAIVAAEYLLKLLPRGTHEYDKLIRPSELLGATRRAGLELIEMTGLAYNPLTQQYRLEAGDVSVNYMIALRKPLD